MRNESQLVSIIVPIYNTEKYLEKCINSLLKQTYKCLEIILVNDGSTDGSRLICEKYKKKDKRIKVINKQNEGLELARKSGYKATTGSYILHVDSDDYLPLDAIDVMLNKAESEKADIVIGNMIRTIGNYGIIRKTYKSIPECSINQAELLEKYYISFFGVNILPVNMCGKLYRKEFLETICIKNIGITHGEDLCYNIQIFPYAKKVTIIDSPVYYYRWGGMTGKMNYQLFEDAKKAYCLKKEMLNKFNVEKAESYIAIELKNFLITYLESFFIYTKMPKEKIEKYISSAIMSEEMQDALKNLPEKSKQTELIQILIKGNAEKLVESIETQVITKRRKWKMMYAINKCLFRFL